MPRTRAASAFGDARPPGCASENIGYPAEVDRVDAFSLAVFVLGCLAGALWQSHTRRSRPKVQVGATSLVDQWERSIPEDERAKLASTAVVECGWVDRPLRKANVYSANLVPPGTLKDALALVTPYAPKLRRAHVILSDGSIIFFDRHMWRGSAPTIPNGYQRAPRVAFPPIEP